MALAAAADNRQPPARTVPHGGQGELAQHHPHPVRSDLEEVVMFRPIVWLLSAAFLILVGAYPPLATFTGSLLLAAFGLGVQGAVLLLAQTAVQIALFAAAAVWAVRSWRTA